MMSLLIMSSGFCSSPWTLMFPVDPRMPVSGPLATALAMYLHAVWMSLTSAINSAPPESLRCSSMMNLERVERRYGMGVFLQAALNTRLARMSAAVSVERASRVTGAPAANSRLACRRRARSSALRIERALAKWGCARRSATYSRKRRKRLVVEAVVLPAEHQRGDLDQLGVVVVGEIDVVRDARREARIAAEEGVHPVLVAGENDDQVVALVLHHLQQDLDHLLPVVAFVLGPVEVIRLVDEQHAAHRALQHLLGLGRGVADVLADEVVARHRDEMTLAHVAQAMQDLRHLLRHRGLAGAGIAGEAHVQRRRRSRESQRCPRPGHDQVGGDFADALLDRLQADQFAIERIEHVLHVGIAQQCLQIDGGGSVHGHRQIVRIDGIRG